MMENIIFSTDKNAGSQMVVLQMYILYLQKLMVISLLPLLLSAALKDLPQGPEEHKMGIKGSSTVQLYFQDCKVPVENVLGEIGRGHIIAFNILNIGR